MRQIVKWKRYLIPNVWVNVLFYTSQITNNLRKCQTTKRMYAKGFKFFHICSGAGNSIPFHESQNCIFAIKYNRIQGNYAPNFRSWEGFGRSAPHVLTLCSHPHKYINFLISLPCPFHCHEDSAFQDNDIFYQVVIALSFRLFHTPAI